MPSKRPLEGNEGAMVCQIVFDSILASEFQSDADGRPQAPEVEPHVLTLSMQTQKPNFSPESASNPKRISPTDR